MNNYNLIDLFVCLFLSFVGLKLVLGIYAKFIFFSSFSSKSKFYAFAFCFVLSFFHYSFFIFLNSMNFVVTDLFSDSIEPFRFS